MSASAATTPETLATPVNPSASNANGRSLVLYDGDCPLCQKTVALLKPLDWLSRLHFQSARDVAALPVTEPPLSPQRLLEEMHVVSADRKRVLAGFDTFRFIAWRLPLTWPIAPLLSIPGVPFLGNRVYLWIAKRRFGLSACVNGVCSLPQKVRKSVGTGQKTVESARKTGETVSV